MTVIKRTLDFIKWHILRNSHVKNGSGQVERGIGNNDGLANERGSSLRSYKFGGDIIDDRIEIHMANPSRGGFVEPIDPQTNRK